MKKIFLYTSTILLITITACNKYLDKEPDNRAKLNTPEKVSQFLGTAYPQGNYQAFAETMSDNVEDIGNGSVDRTINDAYKYIDSRENQQDSPENYWYTCYSAIAVANQALQTISETSDTSLYRAQKGEALLARAYAHFMLANFFCKFYDETTSSSDPGIPYVTVPENVVIKQYERKTVKYVYDMIEKDLLEGLPLIEDKNYNVPKYHFNRAAATAFATRFYLFKKSYANVLKYADLTIPGSNYGSSLRGWTTSYQDITDVSELFKIYAKSTEAANLLLVETSSIWARNYYSNIYGVGVAKQGEASPRSNVLTGGIFGYKHYSISEGTHQLIPKIDEYFVKTSVNANFGQPYVMVPLFAVEEVLFNQAEALAYTGDTTGAIALLNTFASKRILNYDASTHNITSTKINSVFPEISTEQGTKRLPGIIQAILYYKRAEFIHEGLRWLDILRYKIPVTHNILKEQSIILGPDDPRRVIQLPQSTIAAGLAPNPR